MAGWLNGGYLTSIVEVLPSIGDTVLRSGFHSLNIRCCNWLSTGDAGHIIRHCFLLSDFTLLRIPTPDSAS
jgi:hypothetical protein